MPGSIELNVAAEVPQFKDVAENETITRGSLNEKVGEQEIYIIGDQTSVNAGERMMHTGEDKEMVAEQRIVLNVSGVKFETNRSTLERDISCNLARSEFRERFYSPEHGEYFFDRDPDMFKAVLNYLRTGELHLPSFICGPAARIEINFWGIATNRIERCCWINYNEWNSTQEALIRLERDRKLNVAIDVPTNSTCWQRWRPVIWTLLNHGNTRGARIMGIISLSFVMLSIFSFLAETTHYFDHELTESPSEASTETPVNNLVDSTRPTTASNLVVHGKHPLLLTIDIVCIIYFCLEYIARIIFAPNKCKNAKSILSVIDIIAIIPDLVEIIMYTVRPDLKQNVDAVKYITLLRVMRVLRIFRLVRHSAGLWILIYTLRASFNELLLLFWFMSLGVLVFASLIYYAEDRDRFKSIPDGFWWALITMTTVGYGDMYPVTILGKIVGSMCAMCGVLLIGFTVPALVNNFILYYRHVQFAMHVEKHEQLERRLSKDSRKSSVSRSQTVMCDAELVNNNKGEDKFVNIDTYL